MMTAAAIAEAVAVAHARAARPFRSNAPADIQMMARINAALSSCSFSKSPQPPCERVSPGPGV